MVDPKTKVQMLEKIEGGEFSVADLPEFLALFCEICNESVDAQDEVRGWNRTLLLNIKEGGDIWFNVKEGRFTISRDPLPGPVTVLRAKGEVAAGILTGEKDDTAAYLSHALEVEGELPDAVKLRSLIEIVREELEMAT